MFCHLHRKWALSNVCITSCCHDNAVFSDLRSAPMLESECLGSEGMTRKARFWSLQLVLCVAEGSRGLVALRGWLTHGIFSGMGEVLRTFPDWSRSWFLHSCEIKSRNRLGTRIREVCLVDHVPLCPSGNVDATILIPVACCSLFGAVPLPSLYNTYTPTHPHVQSCTCKQFKETQVLILCLLYIQFGSRKFLSFHLNK